MKLREIKFRKIWVNHSGDAEDSSLLGCFHLQGQRDCFDSLTVKVKALRSFASSGFFTKRY